MLIGITSVACHIGQGYDFDCVWIVSLFHIFFISVLRGSADLVPHPTVESFGSVPYLVRLSNQCLQQHCCPESCLLIF